MGEAQFQLWPVDLAVFSFFVAGNQSFSFLGFELGYEPTIFFKKSVQLIHVFGVRGDIAVPFQWWIHVNVWQNQYSIVK